MSEHSHPHQQVGSQYNADAINIHNLDLKGQQRAFFEAVQSALQLHQTELAQLEKDFFVSCSDSLRKSPELWIRDNPDGIITSSIRAIEKKIGETLFDTLCLRLRIAVTVNDQLPLSTEDEGKLRDLVWKPFKVAFVASSEMYSSAGAIKGISAGATAGAYVGTFIFPGLGSVAGAVVGGLLGVLGKVYDDNKELEYRIGEVRKALETHFSRLHLQSAEAAAFVLSKCLKP